MIEYLVKQAREFNRDSNEFPCDLSDRLNEHVRLGGRLHIDILTDDDDGVKYAHIYAMVPEIKDGVVIEWQCDGCGYTES